MFVDYLFMNRFPLFLSIYLICLKEASNLLKNTELNKLKVLEKSKKKRFDPCPSKLCLSIPILAIKHLFPSSFPSFYFKFIILILTKFQK